jgi:pimeloyl-ACP methyl ester carboxylesterase
VDEGTRCGYLTVPQEHGKKSSSTKKLRLAVVIYKSKVEPAQPDPLFIAQGGPGGSTIDTYAPILMESSIRNGRDIVLFDQRGTMHSDPQLTCPEFSLESLTALQTNQTKEKRQQLSLEAAKACYDRLVAQGIDLSAFNSRENAADIEALRQALGYQRINLYGVSYGTLLALHTMRYFPSSLRSVVLDAVAPLQTNYIAESPRSAHNAFEKLFKSCQADEACRQAYPDLKQVYLNTVTYLNELPITIQLTHPKTQQKIQVLLDGDTFQNTLFRLLYISPFLPALPKLIQDVADGNYDLLSLFLSLLVFDDSTSLGMFFSVVCTEYDQFTPSDSATPQSPIALQKYWETENIEKVCGLWKVKQTVTNHTPVKSDIPTLVLSGAFDPITPETFALMTAKTLSRSYSFTFPNVGHGVMFTGECQDQILEEFLQNPLKPPQASCLSSLNPPQFYTSATVIHLPVFIRLLNLQAAAWLQVIFYWICLLVMLSAAGILLSPRLAQLWNNEIVLHVSWASFKSLIKDSLLAAKVLAALNSAAVLLFTILFVIIVSYLFSTNDIRLYFGLPGQYKPLFVIPLLNLVITFFMGFLVLRAWLLSKWNRLWRIYYTVMTLAAVFLISIWHVWGILGAWIN